MDLFLACRKRFFRKCLHTVCVFWKYTKLFEVPVLELSETHFKPTCLIPRTFIITFCFCSVLEISIRLFHSWIVTFFKMSSVIVLLQGFCSAVFRLFGFKTSVKVQSFSWRLVKFWYISEVFFCTLYHRKKDNFQEQSNIDIK